MPAPSGAAHVVYSGRIGGSEEFAFGYWVQWLGGTVDAPSFQASFGTLIDDQAATLSTLVTALLAGTDGITAADAYYYTGGSSKAAFQAHEDLAVFGTGAPTLPNQAAMVASLRSGLPGRSRRGRMYLPATGADLTGAVPLQFNATFCATVATAVQSLLNAGIPDGWRPYVVSPTTSSMVPVTTVLVDSLIDTQRRRGQSLVPLTLVSRGITPVPPAD